MDKAYNHHDHEEKIYSLWEKADAFRAAVDKTKKPFTIIMPPPNANDPLHIGHARFVAIEDTLTRYHRMKGERTLWLPGSDHAGIETQFVFEKKLKEKGQSRFDFDRDVLYKMIWDYVEENTGIMQKQLRQLGASCDWSRHKFTLDPDIIKIVYKTFKKLWDEKFIYRGEKLVNYCTFCGTAYSELEVNHVERTDPLYFIRFPYANNNGYITIATTRPETIYIDTYLAINPKDKRHKKLKDEKIINPLSGSEMKIIEDKFVDIKFGTGIVKITPAHDFDDEQVGIKHGIPSLQIVGQDGKITAIAKKYAGLYVKEARKMIVADLFDKGFIEKIDENYKHTIGVCYRCKNVIEPMPQEQWFIKMEHLAALGRKEIKDKKVTFNSKKYERIAMHWLNNLRDWNISRQIVWGMRIPAWKCHNCKEWTITEGNPPKNCLHCAHRELTQDQDTFDTWFSSGQWPFATLMTTNKGDFEYFYPTSVMNTAYDILPFWVIRMIMLGKYVTGDIPFEKVLIHGLVRDKQGQKISKSKGNVINPIEMAEKYGADALRMGIIWGALVENDISLSEDNIRGQRNFSNKIWNIARFIKINIEGRELHRMGQLMPEINAKDSSKELIWCYSCMEERNKIAQSITAKLDAYRLNEAAEILYDYIWNKLASEHLETVKNWIPENEADTKYLWGTLIDLLEHSLKLLHPFMPFVTEAIWQQNKDLFEESLLISSSWPNAS